MGIQPLVNAAITMFHPHIILMMIGTNDIGADHAASRQRQARATGQHVRRVHGARRLQDVADDRRPAPNTAGYALLGETWYSVIAGLLPAAP
jgi:hypothetical protein